MKKLKYILSFLLITIMFFSCDSDDNTSQKTVLTEEEKSDLLTLIEEEKLARDVYLFSYDKYAIELFNNISDSEQRHMNKILDLLNKYNLSDPVLPNRGEFINQELQELYNQLTSQASISLIEAYKVGATIEDLDIKDIMLFSDRTNKEDILSVYNKLECGSRNHIRMYYDHLLQNNFIYSAQFITQEYFTTIINETNEQCGQH